MAVASTCTTTTTPVVNGYRTYSRVKCSATRCVVALPVLLQPPPSITASRKQGWYSCRIARNVVQMATGDYASTAETTAEVITKSAEADKLVAEEPKVNAESTSEVSTEMPEIVKTIQDAWEKVEDKYEVSLLAFTGFVALWGATGMISAIDRLPLVPGVLELVGIGYSGWFAYNNFLSTSKREALLEKIKCTYGDVIGSS